MLTPRQQETLEHIKEKGIESYEDIILYCKKKLSQPWKTSYTKHPNAPRTERRRHSKKYYTEIISHFETGCSFKQIGT